MFQNITAVFSAAIVGGNRTEMGMGKHASEAVRLQSGGDRISAQASAANDTVLYNFVEICKTFHGVSFGKML
jgi:hypothetical protein